MMNFVTISLVIFACLASAQAKAPNLAELKKTVLANEDALPRILKIYKTAGYSTMESIIDENLSFGSDRKRVENFPTNLSIDALNSDQYDIYQSMLEKTFFFSRVTNASHLSDALKTGVIYVATIKGRNNFQSRPTPEELLNKVMETIVMEFGVLNNGRLQKPKSKLENLYAELAEINEEYEDIGSSTVWWLLSNGFVEVPRDNCERSNSLCSNYQLKAAMEKLRKVDKRMRDNTPINSKQKVQNLLYIIPEYFLALAEFREILIAKDLNCLFDFGGCKK